MFEKYSDEWVNDIKRNKSIYLYGAGDAARRMSIFCQDKGIIIDKVFVSTKPDDTMHVMGLDVDCYKKEEIIKDSLVLVAIAKSSYIDVINRLNDDGVKYVHTPIDWYDLNRNISSDNYPVSMKEWFVQNRGEILSLESPVTFNEKICWLKLFDPQMNRKRMFVDKYEVKRIISDMIGSDHVAKVYGIWDRFDDIDFDQLPERFVLKCTHGNGYNFIVKDKRRINLSSMKEKFDEWMLIDPEYRTLELQYKSDHHRIIAEELLESKNGEEGINDYKIFVFDGSAKLIQVDVDRFRNHRRNIYSTDWKLLDVEIGYPKANDVHIAPPGALQDMICMAELIGKGFCHARVDFYYVNETIYFGEVTFSHGGGVERITPRSFDVEMGKWIRLPIDELSD